MEHDALIPQHKPIGEAPRDIAAIAEQEQASQLPHWNATVAFQLGCALRTRLLTFSSPCVINISTPSTPAHTLFACATHSGTTPDNDIWVARKRAAVIRWGASTWRLHHVYGGGDEELFRKKIGQNAGDYAIHGGGVPIYVRGVEGPVAVVVVSGLKQWDDHQVVIEELAGVCKALKEGKDV